MLGEGFPTFVRRSIRRRFQLFIVAAGFLSVSVNYYIPTTRTATRLDSDAKYVCCCTYKITRSFSSLAAGMAIWSFAWCIRGSFVDRARLFLIRGYDDIDYSVSCKSYNIVVASFRF